MALRVALAGLVLCAAGACATVPPPEPAGRPFLPYQLAPQPPPVARGDMLRTTQTLGESGKPTSPPVGIDAALIRFAVGQRNARATLKPGTLMPVNIRSDWSEILGEVDRFLRQPVATTVPLDVVRARVALEAEIDMDRELYLSLPEGLAAGVKARTLALDLRLREIRKGKEPAPAPGQLCWPVEPVVVTSLFGMRADPINGEDHDHQGVDLRADKGQLVQAASAGLVTRAGRAGGYGLQVAIAHGDGLITTYSHLSTLLVTEGTQIPARGPVGLAGSTGHSTGPHLHFEIWRDGQAVDPLSELPDPQL
jgi:murein DD-endopeptidase MepM/ murein hydrolase activator NlpD